MIQYNHMQHHVGYYATAEDAARAYDRKALIFMGPCAITNFPPSNYAGEDLTADGTAEEQVLAHRILTKLIGDLVITIATFLQAYFCNDNNTLPL
jgi:hypothetical protein